MRFIILGIIIALATISNAQIKPTEGRKLHYRIIGFTDPKLPPTGNGVLQIAKGHYKSADSFSKKILITQKFIGKKTIAEVPDFGMEYTWRINTANGAKGELHHFNVMYCKFIDSASYRLRVVRKATKHADGYTFLDGFGTLFDMAGKPVWFVPLLEDAETNTNSLRDIKLSPANTVTYLYKEMPYEITWDGLLLWKGPNTGVVSSEKSENYHHEFTMLSNGHYMVLGTQNNVLSMADPSFPTKFGTVIEYDKEGNVVWYWRSSDYYKNTDYLYGNRTPKTPYDIHQNSFCFDEKRQNLYVSFKNISQIVKVKYPEKEVVHVYGKRYGTIEDNNIPSQFYEQHSCHVSSNGNLYLYNNNNRDGTAKNFHPKIAVFKETSNGNLLPVWEYEYTSVHNKQKVPELILTSGGNVIELPDGSFFASSCSPYSNLFIVDKKKNLHWEAIPEKYYPETSMWRPNQQYRASLVLSRKQLEQLIWKME